MPIVLPLLLLAACTHEDPLAQVPAGAWLVGDARAIGPWLGVMAGWEGTDLAAHAARVQKAVAACPAEVSVGLPPEATEPSVRCGVGEGLAPLAERARGHAGAFLLPEGGVGRAAGTLEVDPKGGFVADARLTAPPAGTAWDLLLPDAGPPGADVLSSEGALVHGRVRQAQVADVGALTASKGGAEDVFAMKGQLFAASLLAGTWELAIWPPAPDGVVPGAALAVGVRSETVAKAAATEYVTSLSKRWPFVSTPTDVAGQPASCLAGLKLLPELTPCWLVAKDHVFIAWNAASLERGLRPATREAPRSELVVDLAAFPAADAALTRTFSPPGTGAPPDHYPWRRLSLTGAREGDDVLLTLTGEAR